MRTVHCVKLQREAPGLEVPPFPGELGQEIFEKVSAEVWRQWSDDLMIKVINEYRLNMADPAHYEKLLEQMRLFLNLKEGSALEVGDAKRGQG